MPDRNVVAPGSEYLTEGCDPADIRKTNRLRPPQGSPVLENNFSYHAPKPGQPEKYEALRGKAKELAYLIKEHCPDSRESSTAMTHLETAVMWANAAIARNS